MPDAITLPHAVAVMPLPGAVLFPHALLPLYIFEQRYRAMLEYALAEQRMLCVALIKRERSEWHALGDFRHVATVGLIRACIGRPDGTSNLILQGLQRVRFSGFRQAKPFPIAQITPQESIAADSLETETLTSTLLHFYATMKRKGRRLPDKVDEYLSDVAKDPEMLADLMAATFVSDPSRRQQLLEELSVKQRLRLLIVYLREEIGDAAA